jgi:penicillin-binding protein 1A
MHTLFYGGPVDGGTFPAAIWGVYMKSIIGNFCGSFPPPKEPFQSSPFFGEYSSTGGGKLGFGDGEEEETTEPVAPEPTEEPEEDTAPSGGTEFDPEQYESAPQDAPETEDPDTP